MLLTSLNRTKAGLGITKAAEDALLGRLISAASLRIARYLRRVDEQGASQLQLTSRTKYFSPSFGQRAFVFPAYPISSVTSVYLDSTGRYTGSETLIASTDYLVSEDGRTLILDADPSSLFTFSAVYPKSLRVIYTAGLASTPVVSSWTKSGGTLTVGKFVQGGTSGAIGKVTATAAGTLSYESYSGVFEAAETLTEYTTFDASLQDGGLSNASGQTCTLTAVTTQSLAEAYPDLTQACEFFVDHLRRNRHDSDSQQVMQEGANRFGSQDQAQDFFANPMIRDLLERFKNTLVEG